MTRPTAFVIATESGYVVKLKVEENGNEKFYSWQAESRFGVGLILSLIRQKFPDAVVVEVENEGQKANP